MSSFDEEWDNEDEEWEDEILDADVEDEIVETKANAEYEVFEKEDIPILEIDILMYKLLITKIKNKPGDGGFFVNVDKLGNIEWLKVDFVNIEKKFKKIDNEYVKASTGALFLHKDLLK